MRKVRVRCTYEIEVEVPDDEEGGYSAQEDIEENHCPGTGRVGAMFDTVYAHHEKHGTCWGCTLNGKNKIIFPMPAAPEKHLGTPGWEARLANDLRALFKLYGLDPGGPAFGSFISAMEATLTGGKPGAKA